MLLDVEVITEVLMIFACIQVILKATFIVNKSDISVLSKYRYSYNVRNC